MILAVRTVLWPPWADSLSVLHKKEGHWVSIYRTVISRKPGPVEIKVQTRDREVGYQSAISGTLKTAFLGVAVLGNTTQHCQSHELMGRQKWDCRKRQGAFFWSFIGQPHIQSLKQAFPFTEDPDTA